MTNVAICNGAAASADAVVSGGLEVLVLSGDADRQVRPVLH